MKKYSIFILLSLLASAVVAQAPKGYYERANGLKKEALKDAMHSIICKATVLEYGSGAGKTWTGFYSTDRLPDNQVLDRYSNEKFYFSSTATAAAASAPSGMNIEHSFPKSWWGGTNNQAYKDLYNLMPCETKINSSKSNYAMGVVKTVKTDNGCTKVGTGQAGSKMANLWEPADKWKGDFARNYFYMVTAYSNLTWSGEGLTMLQNDEWPTLQRWAYELFLQWNRQDPVDDIERKRNEAVYAIQGNRNPFIDYPNLAEYIWGDSIAYAFSVDGSSQGNGDDPTPKPGELVAYPASEIVCSVNSRRFDANWSKYKEGCVYTLDVYTKDANGNHLSLAGFPVETSENTYRVKDVKANTTYYYTVYVYEDGVLAATSNEIQVDMPDVQPIFTSSVTKVNLSAQPDTPSDMVEIKLTLMAVKEYKVAATCTYPFEISPDGESWSLSLTLTGSSPVFYVRLSAQEDEGNYNGTLTLKCQGATDIVIPLLAQVSQQKAFFENFETGAKSSYAAASVQCAAAKWYMSDALLGKDVKANDAVSARIKGGGYIAMEQDKARGCDSLWFFAAPYGSDTNMSLTVSYSLDEGETWTPVVSELHVDAWQRYGYKINSNGNIRLKFEAIGSKRINVDDIQMSNYHKSDAVDDVGASATHTPVIYDLSGRRVHRLGAHGVFIVNGLKAVR